MWFRDFVRKAQKREDKVLFFVSDIVSRIRSI
jgi:hypothetical protein